MKSTEEVIKGFRTGLNCAQSVVTAFSDEIYIDEKLLQSISCGFGAGMGKLQQTCGPVSGSFMLISLHNSNKFKDNKQRNEGSEKMIQDFYADFIKQHGTTCCENLMDCDLNTPEGKKYAADHKLSERVCEECIISSVNILRKLFRN